MKSSSLTLLLLFSVSSVLISPSISALVKEQPLVLKYHKGPLLKGKITVNLIWYGYFTPIQRSIIVDFISSLSSTSPSIPSPSAASWWRTTAKYRGGGGATTLVLGKQYLYGENYSLGRNLKNSHVIALSKKIKQNGALNSINVVLTAGNVLVEGFCMNRCGSHGSNRVGSSRVAYAWVGNPETQCPGQCAWPFKMPIYGPQTPPLVSPNSDVGSDGMVINLATVLAGTVTNPFNNGYYQGSVGAQLEAVSACTGKFGSGAYPGYPGKVLVDEVTGASYNAHGVNGRKYLVPGIWDPQTSSCFTLV